MRHRFVRLPIAVLNDARLSDGAIRVFAVMLDASRDDLSIVSLRRLGERLGRKRDAARRSVRELIAAGHVVEVPVPNGACPRYRLHTRSENATPPHSKNATGTGGKNATGERSGPEPVAKTPRDPLQKRYGTRSENATQPILTSLNSFPNDVAREEDDNGGERDTRATTAAKLKSLGLTSGQAQHAVDGCFDVAKAWATIGFDGVPTTGISNPVAFIAAALRDGNMPQKQRRSAYPNATTADIKFWSERGLSEREESAVDYYHRVVRGEETAKEAKHAS